METLSKIFSCARESLCGSSESGGFAGLWDDLALFEETPDPPIPRIITVLSASSSTSSTTSCSSKTNDGLYGLEYLISDHDEDHGMSALDLQNEYYDNIAFNGKAFQECRWPNSFRQPADRYNSINDDFMNDGNSINKDTKSSTSAGRDSYKPLAGNSISLRMISVARRIAEFSTTRPIADPLSRKLSSAPPALSASTANSFDHSSTIIVPTTDDGSSYSSNHRDLIWMKPNALLQLTPPPPPPPPQAAARRQLKTSHV